MRSGPACDEMWRVAEWRMLVKWKAGCGVESSRVKGCGAECGIRSVSWSYGWSGFVGGMGW